DTVQLLSTETNARAVVLHFSGYGYQKRGVPVWLVQGLQIWSRRAGRVPLLTIFHELYASGRPWQSAFWVSPLQKQIMRSILKLSSAAITPTDLCSKMLSEWRDGDATEITTMPVFSNVGEPGCECAPCARTAGAGAFGVAGGRVGEERRGPWWSVWPEWKIAFLAFIVQKSSASFQLLVSRKYSMLGRACPQCLAL